MRAFQFFPRVVKRAASISHTAQRQSVSRSGASVRPAQARIIAPLIQRCFESSLAHAQAGPGTRLPRPAAHRNPDEPIYQLTFTCRVCKERSSHTVSKQGYHKGTVLITCSGCKGRHLISDHLRVRTSARCIYHHRLLI